MGTWTDCLRPSLQPEIQKNCRWGNLSLSTTSTPPQKKSVVVDSYDPPIYAMLSGAPATSITSLASSESLDLDSYEPPSPKKPFDNYAEPSVILVQGNFGRFQLKIGAWAAPTGFSTETDRPISVAMDQWKNGGVPFPPGVEYMLFGGGQIRF